MAASITVHLQIFKRPQLLRFPTDLDETGIKIHDLLRSFILNIVIVRVAVPFRGRLQSIGISVNKLTLKAAYSATFIKTD